MTPDEADAEAAIADLYTRTGPPPRPLTGDPFADPIPPQAWS
jgi:hypothetical protein